MSVNSWLATALLWGLFLCFANEVRAQRIISDAENIGSNTVKSTGSDSLRDPEEDAKREAPVYVLRRGQKEFTFEFGASPFNPTTFGRPKEYNVRGRGVYLSSFRFGRVIGNKGPVTYEYSFGVTPLAVFLNNQVRTTKDKQPWSALRDAPTVRRTTYGVGVQPVNFRFIFRPRARLKPFAQVGAGLLFTSRSMPVPRATWFNFTGDFGGGFQYFTSERRAITLGYKYFHVSNGNIGGKVNNPGLNANVFYMSYSVFGK